jgi:DNA primase catalytic core
VDVIGGDVELRQVGNSLQGLSPFQAEAHPSFTVWPASQRWRDYAGGSDRGGDVFDYVMQRDHVGFWEAVVTLAERYSVRRPDQDAEAWQRAQAALGERREVERLLTAAASYYHRALPTEIREAWYRGRYGFTDATIDDFQLGWADGALYAHFAQELGVSRELALKTGLFVVLGGGRVVDFFRNRLVFPYWRAGRVVYMIARRTEHTSEEAWEQAKYKKLPTHSAKHHYVSEIVSNDYLYNEDAARGATELVITEGLTDCISAHQAGFACLSTATTRVRTQDVPHLLQLTRHAERLIICNDAEENEAGEEGARATAAALWGKGRDVRIAVIPRPEGVAKIDVNELVVQHGPEALRDVIAAARSYPDYLLDRIPADTPPGELEQQLEPVLAAIAGRSPIAVDIVLTAVTAKLGVGKRALSKRAKELAAARRADIAVHVDGAAAVPEIDIANQQMSVLIDEVHRLLADANERRLQNAVQGRLARELAPLLARGGMLTLLQRTPGTAPALSPISQAEIYGILCREADWIRVTAGGKQAAQPPEKLVRDLGVYPPPGIPAVESVITTPVFGRDGHLIVEPGLHRDDQLWLEADPTLTVGEIPKNPTGTEVATAVGLLSKELLGDFPFAGEADVAHALAAILLPFVRPLIEGCTPLHVIDAPQPGSGKTLVAKLIAIIATGQEGASRTLAESEDEIRKMVTAELILARPIVLLDNARVGRVIRSSALAAALTAAHWTDRLLGQSRMVSLPVRALWLLSGNNVRCSREIARRSVSVRITPIVDQPWLRAGFRHADVAGWARDNRGALVRAALVLGQAWIAAGRPAGPASLGSYEAWAQVMGGILEVAGVPGFLGNLQDQYAAADDDDDDEVWRELIDVWWDRWRATEVRVADLDALCEERDLLRAVRGGGSERSRQTKLGAALRDIRDRIYGAVQVRVRHDARSNRAVWVLEPVGPPLLDTGIVPDLEPDLEPYPDFELDYEPDFDPDVEPEFEPGYKPDDMIEY